MQQCFKYAIDQGVRDIHVLGHYDPLHPVLLRPTTWRNLINIGPRQKASADGLSYYDVMIKPVTAALAAAASPGVSVWYSVSGEMGLSNFLNAREWKAELDEARTQLKQKPWKVIHQGFCASTTQKIGVAANAVKFALKAWQHRIYLQSLVHNMPSKIQALGRTLIEAMTCQAGPASARAPCDAVSAGHPMFLTTLNLQRHSFVPALLLLSC